MSYEMTPTRVVSKRGKKIVVYDNTPIGLGSFDLISAAQAIQAGADKIQSNIQTGTSWLQSLTQKLNVGVANVSDAANRVGAAVSGGTKGAIASAATGDTSSGLTAAALTTKPVLVGAGVLLAMWVFSKHPGHRGL